jgi:hypothetical protein
VDFVHKATPSWIAAAFAALLGRIDPAFRRAARKKAASAAGHEGMP